MACKVLRAWSAIDFDFKLPLDVESRKPERDEESSNEDYEIFDEFYTASDTHRWCGRSSERMYCEASEYRSGREYDFIHFA